MSFKPMFESPSCPTPDPGGNHEGTRGGYDLPDGRKETPGNGDLPLAPTITSFQGVTPGKTDADRTIEKHETSFSTNGGKR